MDKKYIIARNLRKNSTIQEKRLWNIIKNRQINGYKFKRQVPVGEYIVDFMCAEINLVIEIDGGQHNKPDNIEHDNKRTEFLNSKGYKVLRFWNNDIYENIDGVIAEIEKYLK